MLRPLVTLTSALRTENLSVDFNKSVRIHLDRTFHVFVNSWRILNCGKVQFAGNVKYIAAEIDAEFFQILKSLRNKKSFDISL